MAIFRRRPPKPPAPLRRPRDSGAGYKCPDLPTYLTKATNAGTYGELWRNIAIADQYLALIRKCYKIQPQNHSYYGAPIGTHIPFID